MDFPVHLLGRNLIRLLLDMAGSVVLMLESSPAVVSTLAVGFSALLVLDITSPGLRLANGSVRVTSLRFLACFHLNEALPSRGLI